MMAQEQVQGSKSALLASCVAGDARQPDSDAVANGGVPRTGSVTIASVDFAS